MTIIANLSNQFLSHCTLEDQGRFAIGYYHQRQARAVQTESLDEPQLTQGDHA